IALGNVAEGTVKTILYRERILTQDPIGSSLPNQQIVLTNTETASSSNTNSVTDSASVTILVTTSNLTISSQKLVRDVTASQTSFVDSTTVSPGDLLEYKITVTVNRTTSGNQVAANLKVTDSIPDKLN